MKKTMYAIKEYKPKLIVYYKDIDGSISYVLTDLEKKQALLKALNEKRFVDIEGIILKTDNIVKIEKYEVKNSLDKWIATLPPQMRREIEKRNKEKYEKVGRYIESIEEAQQYLRKKGFKI